MEIVARAYGHPHVALLVDRLQAEYTRIYGGPDQSPVEPAQFAPPRGDFAVGYEDGVPVAMGGWRFLGDGRAELKRMYVVDERRARGHSRSMLTWLEGSAAAAGATALVLETHQLLPAAVNLYRSCGYVDVSAFGYHADDPLSVYLGFPLPRRSPADQAPVPGRALRD